MGEDSMKKYEKSCGAIVYHEADQENYFLVIHHKNGGHWAFAKGHVENDETETEAAYREIREETNLKHVDMDTAFRKVISYSPAPGVEKEVIYFIGKVSRTDVAAAEKQEEEILEMKWLPFNEAYAHVSYKSDKKILKEAYEYLSETRK